MQQNLSLADVEAEIDDAEARGQDAWRDLARSVALVHSANLWSQATVPIATETDERRPCKSFAEWCEVCREKKKTWGYQLLNAHAFSSVASNERQARELAGLSAEEARQLVEKATERGTRNTTAEELRALRADAAIAKLRGDKDQAQARLRQRRQRDWTKDVEIWVKKGRTLFRREIGTEWIEAILDDVLERATQEHGKKPAAGKPVEPFHGTTPQTAAARSVARQAQQAR